MEINELQNSFDLLQTNSSISCKLFNQEELRFILFKKISLQQYGLIENMVFNTKNQSNYDYVKL